MNGATVRKINPTAAQTASGSSTVSPPSLAEARGAAESLDFFLHAVERLADQGVAVRQMHAQQRQSQDQVVQPIADAVAEVGGRLVGGGREGPALPGQLLAEDRHGRGASMPRRTTPACAAITLMIAGTEGSKIFSSGRRERTSMAEYLGERSGGVGGGSPSRAGRVGSGAGRSGRETAWSLATPPCRVFPAVLPRRGAKAARPARFGAARAQTMWVEGGCVDPVSCPVRWGPAARGRRQSPYNSIIHQGAKNLQGRSADDACCQARSGGSRVCLLRWDGLAIRPSS